MVKLSEHMALILCKIIALVNGPLFQDVVMLFSRWHKIIRWALI